MHRLSKEEVANALALDNPDSAGAILEYLVNSYGSFGHSSFVPEKPITPCIAALVGPPLARLPSFLRKDHLREQRQEHAGKREKHPLVAHNTGDGLPGLAEPVDTLHLKMRQFGRDLGKLFYPAMAGHIDPATLGQFNKSDVEKLEKIDEVHLPLDPTKPPLTVHSYTILQRAFLIAAAARIVATRTLNERIVMDDQIGTLRRTYGSMWDLHADIEKSMQKDDNYRGKRLADYGMRFDTDAVAEAFQARQAEFRTLYNYLYIHSNSKMPSQLRALKACMEDAPPGKSGIYLQSTGDLAAAMAALFEQCGLRRSWHQEFCLSLMQSPDLPTAAHLLRESHYLDVMHGTRATEWVYEPILREITALCDHYPDRSHVPGPMRNSFHNRPGMR